MYKNGLQEEKSREMTITENERDISYDGIPRAKRSGKKLEVGNYLESRKRQ